MASTNSRGVWFALEAETNSAPLRTAFPFNRMRPGDLLIVTDATATNPRTYNAVRLPGAAVPTLVAGPVLP